MLDIALAVAFEAIEPDEWIPAGLPVDDIARKAVIKGAKEALKEGGGEALERYLRKELGERSVLKVLNLAFASRQERLWRRQREVCPSR